MASPFSGGAGRRASIAQGTLVQQGRDQAYGFLNEGRDRSLASLGAGFGQARNDLATGTRGALGELGSAYGTATGAMRTGNREARGYLDSAYDLYTPMAGTAGRGFDLFADATGVNGSAGSERARQAFQAGPGFDFSVKEATDAAVRAANAAGMTASGNTLQAVTDRATGLANQEYGNWLGRLQSWQSLAPQLTGAQASIRGNQATLADSFGRGMADLATGYGRGRADLISGEGRSLADLSRGLGMGEAGIYTADATNRAGIATDTSRELGNILAGGMKAGDQAAANRWNAGMSLAQLGASFLGSGSGGGGGRGGFSLSSLFA